MRLGEVELGVPLPGEPRSVVDELLSVGCAVGPELTGVPESPLSVGEAVVLSPVCCGAGACLSVVWLPMLPRVAVELCYGCCGF